jgi:transcriptional regulator with XRE-family HTH domain
MKQDCENRYKMSRVIAKIKQEDAAELLNVSPRSLSDYENGHRSVPDDIVAKMAEIYKCPLLAWWHLKQFSVLGKFLPDVQMPETKGDMALQMWMAQNSLVPTVSTVMELLGEGICSQNSESFQNVMAKANQVTGMLLSSIMFGQKLVA